MLKLICSLTASSLLLLVSFTANASPITITNSSIGSYARDGLVGGVYDVDTSVLFGSRSLLAVDGGSSSATDINWVDTGSGALFDFDMNHTRTGAHYSISESYASALYFTANENTTYNITGQYTVDDVTSAGRSYSDVFLQNITSGYTMFRDYSYSDNTVDESFTVGIASEGDMSNTFAGSQAGNLIAGNQYRFQFNNYVQAYPTADGGSSATGCVTLSIGGATGAGSCGSSSVPEPMPLTLLGAGLAALGLRRRLLAKAV
jgi:MYXO-CTERM domain-containing protein